MRQQPETWIEKAVGSSAFLKAVNVLLTHPSADYSRRELAEAAGISTKTLYQNWKLFTHLNIVNKTRKIGKAQLYKLNTDSDIAQLIFRLDEAIQKRLKEDAEAEKPVAEQTINA